MRSDERETQARRHPAVAAGAKCGAGGAAAATDYGVAAAATALPAAVDVADASGPQQRVRWAMDQVEADIPRGPLEAPHDRFKVRAPGRPPIWLVL